VVKEPGLVVGYFLNLKTEASSLVAVGPLARAIQLAQGTWAERARVRRVSAAESSLEPAPEAVC
jgi:hypothetical protein